MRDVSLAFGTLPALCGLIILLEFLDARIAESVVTGPYSTPSRVRKYVETLSKCNEP